MKKILVTLLLASSALAYSQISIAISDLATKAPIAPNSVLHFTTIAGDKHTFQIDVKNISTSTQTYSAKRYDLVLNKVTSDQTKASAYFCFAGTCFDSETFVSSAHLI